MMTVAIVSLLVGSVACVVAGIFTLLTIRNMRKAGLL